MTETFALYAAYALMYCAIGEGIIGTIEVVWMRHVPRPTRFEHAIAVLVWPVAVPLAVFVRWLAGRYVNDL